jgi:hypothetical protein
MPRRRFALLPAVFLLLSCTELGGQAVPGWASSLSAQVQTPAANKESAPGAQAPQPSQAPSSVQSSTPSAGPVTHTISVTFDYDFDRTPACTGKIQHHCVRQFVVYDISSGSNHAYPIGTVALPDSPYGQKRGIAGKTDPHVFESGKHLIAVTAQEPEPPPHPLESSTAGCTSCTTWVNIP